MSTAVWSYVPTEGVTEDIESAARGVQWLGKPAIYTAVASHQIRRFTLSWGPCVDSTECNSMLAFYRARLGSFDSFVWRSPIDARTYSVRFDSTIRADNFAPGLWRSGGQLAFTTTHTPTVSTVTNSIFATPYYAGSGAVHPDASSGDGPGLEAFWYPDAWYIAGWQLGDLTAVGGVPQTFTSNRLGAQQFSNATSGIAVDRLGVVVRSGVTGQYVNFGLYIANGIDGNGYFDSYPGSLLATTSCQVNNMGLAVASITKTYLEDTVYWVAYVTSFNTGATFMNIPTHAALTIGQASGDAFVDPCALIYTHSLTMPTTFPASATGNTTNPMRIVFHIASEAV